MGKMHFSGTNWIIELGDQSGSLCRDLLACGAPGPADEAVEYVIRSYQITGDPDDCRAYLRCTGAWDEDALADHDANLSRLVWLTGCDLRLAHEAHFSTYR